MAASTDQRLQPDNATICTQARSPRWSVGAPADQESAIGVRLLMGRDADVRF
jgi:hypothetical protein